MNNPYNNNLFNNYNNYNNQNKYYQNNSLLANNQHIQNTMNSQYSSQANRAQLMNMYQTMSNLKRMYQTNTIAKINELERQRGRIQINNDDLKNAIIKPIKIEKSDEGEILSKFREVATTLETELNTMWSKRTNQPYKNILKNEDYTKNFNKKEDLIVHRVTDIDKLGLDDEYNNLQNQI
jgi:hypothetical protein